MAIEISGTVSTSGDALPGVLVSNGEQVVVTDSDGSYLLEADPLYHSFVWVCTPAGMRAAGGCFYHRIPAGDGQVDFLLEAAPERSAPRFRFAQITDIHIIDDRKLCTHPEVLDEHLGALVADAAPAFVVASGDLSNHGSEVELAAFRDVIRRANARVFPLLGNHDGSEERRSEREDTACVRNHEGHFGPVCYSFDWGTCHLAFFADSDTLFSEEAQRRKLAWLFADLAAQPAGKPTVLVKHFHTDPALLERLSGDGVRLVLYGHWHASRVVRHGETLAAGTPTFCFGGIDSSPRGFRLVEVDGEALSVTLRASQAAALTPRDPEELDGMARRWSAEVPGGLHRAPPVFHNGRLYVSLRDEHDARRSGVLCLDAASGEPLWEGRTDSAVKNAPAVDGDTGVCVAVSVAGRLFTFDLETGHLRWQRDLAGFPERWFYARPVAADGTVYTASQWGAQALRLVDGRELWQTALDQRDWLSCYASPVLTGELLIALVQGRGLVALERRTGAEVWETEFRAAYQWGGPARVGSRLLTTGDCDSLLALDAGTGEKIWETELPEYASGVAVDAARLYAATPVGELRCHALEDGAPLWTFTSGADLLDVTPYRRGIHSLSAPPVLWRDALWLGGNDGVLYKLDPKSGNQLAQESFGAPLTAPPTPTADGLCISTWDGRLRCYA